MRQPGVIGRGTIDRALLFHVMCLCSTSTPLPSPPTPCILQGVWPSLCCQPPPSTQEASIQWPTPNILWGSGTLENKSWDGRGARSREGVPSMMGVVSSGGLTALNVPNLTYLTVRPPPNIPLFFCGLDFVFVAASCVLSSNNTPNSLLLCKSYYIIKIFF